MSRNLIVEEAESDARGLLLAASALGLISLAGALAFAVSRRRRANEELELLTSWDAFRAPSAESGDAPKEVPTLEGDAMDGTEEVQAELDLDFD